MSTTYNDNPLNIKRLKQISYTLLLLLWTGSFWWGTALLWGQEVTEPKAETPIPEQTDVPQIDFEAELERIQSEESALKTERKELLAERKKLRQSNSTAQSNEKRNIFVIAPGLFASTGLGLPASESYDFGLGVSGLFLYEHIAPEQYHFLQLEGGYGRLFSEDFGEGRSGSRNRRGDDRKDNNRNIFANIAYGSHFSVFSRRATTLYLGFNLEANLALWYFDAKETLPQVEGTPQEILQGYGWNANATFGPALSLHIKRTSHNFRVNYYLPVIGAYSHSPYNIRAYTKEGDDSNDDNDDDRNDESDDDNGSRGAVREIRKSIGNNIELFSWEKAFRTSVNLAYEWQFSKHVGLYTRYDLALDAYYAALKPTVNLTHQFDFGFSFFW